MPDSRTRGDTILFLDKGETKGDTPLESPFQRGYTPLDTSKGEKEQLPIIYT